MINIEAQKKWNPGYEIVTRGIFYCARMISGQKHTEFEHSDQYLTQNSVKYYIAPRGLQSGIAEACLRCRHPARSKIRKRILKKSRRFIPSGSV